ncbi:hypothetical protein PALB_23110 [Pseudoalteromonas luteoviolacea B = ATCC 29581]|nr:hypothetical protein PALB_23110 [Pseudoalteromonas luteoviolacea B = ATCC 29581]
MAKDYNFIYKKLVESDDDIHGIISYSVYKRQKIQFIQNFKDKYNREPSEEELQPFNEISTSPSQLEFYKSEATVLTENFLANVLEADLKEREEFFSAKVHSELMTIKPNHFFDIVKSALGSFVFVLLTGVLYFSVWSLSTSPREVIGHIFDVKIIPNSQAKDLSNGKTISETPSEIDDDEKTK